MAAVADRSDVEMGQWVRWLQDQHAEMLRLLQLQQREIEILKAQNVEWKDLSASVRQQQQQPVGLTSGYRPSNYNNSAAALEAQLQDLVVELRKLQQEHSRTRDLEELLQEVREERGVVVDMLENVKREKCEVIAVMHSFAMDKNTAMQDLSSLHQLAREEITALVTAGQQHVAEMLRSYAAPEPLPAVVVATASRDFPVQKQVSSVSVSVALPDARPSAAKLSHVASARHIRQVTNGMLSPRVPPLVPAPERQDAGSFQAVSPQASVAAPPTSIRQQVPQHAGMVSPRAAWTNLPDRMQAKSPERQASVATAPHMASSMRNVRSEVVTVMDSARNVQLPPTRQLSINVHPSQMPGPPQGMVPAQVVCSPLLPRRAPEVLAPGVQRLYSTSITLGVPDSMHRLHGGVQSVGLSLVSPIVMTRS